MASLMFAAMPVYFLDRVVGGFFPFVLDFLSVSSAFFMAASALLSAAFALLAGVFFSAAG